tara:strand:+ start:1240 stop:1782 length:543 start_codon:yes stop_codon:yes gene_type:complete
MFKVNESKIQGCFELLPNIFQDSRGHFIKVFHKEVFKELGLENNFSEEYYSRSFKDVIRGLHFQVPPKEHAKLVYCTEGSVFDVVLDLRGGSATYGKYDTFNLNSIKSNLLYIPKGIAHGFCSTSEISTLVYKTTTVYDEDCDAGILWNSVGISWPTNKPILSKRDKSFPVLDSFKTPFS